MICVLSLCYFEIYIDNIEDVLKGFNSTIFAYGQTGSGKTFTMFGPHWDDNEGHQNTLGGYNVNALYGSMNLGGSFKSRASGGDPQEQFLKDK